MRTARDGIEALRASLSAQRGPVSELLDAGAPAPDSLAEPGPAQLAATGPRAQGREAEYELVVETILEGSRLHYGPPRIVRTADPDLALIIGDQLYALGLERLAAIGDLYAISELADVISLVAQAHAARDPILADAVWEAGAVAVGWGASADHATAKRLARAGDGNAARALRAAAGAVAQGRGGRSS
jgi:hypothetical protein